MKKRFLNFSLIGALLLGSAVSFVGCKDYDDDIKDLQSQIDANKAAIEALKKSIEDGETIVSVTNNGDGSVTIKTSKDEYVVKPGEDGKDGESTIISIGENGNWYINDTDTGLQAAGTPGTPGTPGASGTPGEDGKDGKDGKYYYPNPETGTWMEVDGDKETDTGTSYLVNGGSQGGGVVAIWDNDTLTLQNVDGYEGDFVIYLTSKLRSMVFVPQAYYKGVPVIDFSALTYKAMTYNTNTLDWYVATSTTDKETQKLNVTAQYHLNPSTVTAEGMDLNNLEYILDRKDIYQTRAAAATDYVTVKNGTINDNGLLTVNLNINMDHITFEEDVVDIVALQAKVKENGKATDEQVVSDYAGLYRSLIRAVRFSNATISEVTARRHYRETRTEIQNNVNSYIDTNATVEYDNEKGLNLTELVQTCFVQVKNGVDQTTHYYNINPEDYGLTYEFELAHLERTGTTAATNQEDFAVVEKVDGIWYMFPRWKETGAISQNTIGRTPLVRVKLKFGDTTILSGYILTQIVNKVPGTVTPKDLTYNLSNVGICDNTTGKLRTTITQMNVIYDELGTSNTDFHNTYDINAATTKLITPSSTTELANMFANVVVIPNDGSETTHLLEWRINHADLWNYTRSNDIYEVEVTYPAKDANGIDAVVPLRLTVTRPAPLTMTVITDMYWENNSSRGLLNVEVPNSDTTCDYIVNINNLFNWGNNKVNGYETVFKAWSGTVYNNVAPYYYFDELNVGKKAGTTNYTLSVQNTATTSRLYANGSLLATIDNSNATRTNIENIVQYSNATTIAKEVLSTDQLEAIINVKGQLGCDTYADVTTFPVRFQNPLKPITVDNITFYDTKTGGNELNVLEAIDLIDWRGVPVVYGSTETGYRNLYQYYEVNSNYIIREDAIRFRDSNNTWYDNLPSTDMKITVNGNILTYANDGATVVEGKTAQLEVPVRINHKWGYVDVKILITIEH